MPRAIRSKAEGEPAVFKALADATRRRILRELGDGEMRAGDLASRFPISRPAVSKHLRVLREAGLLRVRAAGRERWYAIAPGKMRDAAARVQALDGFWKDAISKLADEVRRGRGP